jgi:DNA repair protein RecO (recombination protein O)
MALKRVTAEPGFVLHHYDWSESSLILDAFTRDYGRVTLIAKGAKKPSSNFRPVLLPLQKLMLTFTGDEEVKTLRQAEWVGGRPMPTGTSLMAGFYLNELLIRMLAREDRYPLLFDAYAASVDVLSACNPEAIELALRAFEIVLLKEIGILPQMEIESANLAPVQPHRFYSLSSQGGLVDQGGNANDTLPGTTCLELAEALTREHSGPALLTTLMKASSGALPPLKTQLRQLLLHHVGADGFRTRALMRRLTLI